jgi:hypothetical protein
MAHTIQFNSSSITVTALGNGLRQVTFPVTQQQGDQQESVAVSVTVQLIPSQTLGDIQKAAVHRAIRLLQTAIGEGNQETNT